MNDLIIIGGGPAGVAAGIYAARKRLKTVLVTETIGGQSSISDGIENWIGTPHMSGADLAESLKSHLDAVKGSFVETTIGAKVIGLEKQNGGFLAKISSNRGGETAAVEGRAVLIASGASRRKLEIPGAAKFENKGISYCASCDGPVFSGQDIAVIGGGNAGFETALQLLSYAKSVTLIHRRKDFRADPVSVEKALAHENMNTIIEAEPTEILGDQFVTGLSYHGLATGEEKKLMVSGVFVEIGVAPNTQFAEGLVELDEVKRVKVNAINQRTSANGVWAAGDCTDELYHQNNIAAGDGVKALEDLYLWLKRS